MELYLSSIALHDTPVAQRNVGTCYESLGKTAEAQRAYQRAAELDPEYAKRLHGRESQAPPPVAP